MTARAPRLVVRALTADDGRELVQAVKRSRRLHHPWIYPPSTARAFRVYLAASAGASKQTFVARRADDGAIVGVVSLSEIVRGTFQSAYLGYYGLEPQVGRGLMSEAVRIVVDHAFRVLKLHRIEANIQPANAASIALVRRLGFAREGFSPRYLKIGGRWKDHERWAVLSEDWAKRKGV